MTIFELYDNINRKIWILQGIVSFTIVIFVWRKKLLDINTENKYYILSVVICNIDSLRTNFINSKGTQSSILLRKGNYNMVLNGGWHIGAEIGAYTNGRADDNMLESASFMLIGQDGFEITDRTVEGQFWINVFMKEKQLPSGLKMTTRLEFKNEADAKGYYDALQQGFGEKGRSPNSYFNSMNRDLEDIKVQVSRSGKTVNVIFE